MIKQLIKYAKGYGVRAVFASLAIIVEVLLEVFIPFVMKDVINQGILGDAGMTIVIQKGLLMVGLALASLFFRCFECKAFRRRKCGICEESATGDIL